MCDLMSSNQPSTSNYISAQNFFNSQANDLKSSNSLFLVENPRSAKLTTDYKQIILELRAQNFDVIRFATYRTASKLRFIQKKLNLHLIDLWNVIETFRDNSLHTLDIYSEIDISKIESCVHNMYIQLNKRLAFNQHINVETQTNLLLAWLLNLYDKNRLSSIRVLSLKIALTTMCAGKLIDKIKYIFTQISDPSKNILIIQKFDAYLKDLLILPKSIFEEPSFGYNENLAKTCFDLSVPITIEDFLSVVLSDIGPACFIWLNIFHRFTIVQNVTHPVTCNACDRSHFTGFRYKCQKCRKYQLCQDCFWRGRISHSHQLTHQMKEYTSYKSAAKQFSSTIRRSFFCKPNKLSQPNPQQQKHHISTITQNTSKYFNNRLDNNLNDFTASPSLNNNTDFNLPYKNDKDKLVESKLQAKTLINLSSTANNHNTLPQSTTAPPSSIKNTNNDIYSLDAADFNANKWNNKESSYDSYMNEQNIVQLDLKQSRKDLSNSPNSNYSPNISNTLKITKTKNNEQNTNLITNFLLSNTSQNSNINNEEHNLIANYCSRLSEFYSKNPDIPFTSDTTKLISNDISQTNQQQLQSHTVSSLINSYNSNLRYNRKPNLKNKATIEENKMSENQKNDKKINNYWSNTSLNRQCRINGAKISALNNNQKCVDFKIKHNKTRSLSENNFRQSDDEDDNEENELIRNNNRVISNEISKDLEDKMLNEKRELVAKLEQQNKEILKEIKKLKLKQISNKSLDLIDPQSEYNLEVSEQKYQNKAFNNHLSLKQLNSYKTPQSETLTRKKLNNNYLTISKQRAQMNHHLVAAELQNLKQRKGLLENRMQILENSRDELIDRLTQLDTVFRPESLKKIKSLGQGTSPSTTKTLGNNVSQTQNIAVPVTTIQKITHSPPLIITTTSSSSTYIPVLSSSMAMGIPNAFNNQENFSKNQHNLEQNSQQLLKNNLRSLSQPATPALDELNSYFEPESNIKSNVDNNSLLSLVKTANLKNDEIDHSNKIILNNSNGSASNLRTLRNDLFSAADSVTNAMQSLVNELNNENEIYTISNNFAEKNYNNDEDSIVVNNLENLNHENFNGNIRNFNNNRYITSHSLSASSTPVTYRRNFNFFKRANLINRNFNANITDDDFKNDLVTNNENNFENFENGNVELNDENIVISQLNNLNDSRLILMNETFNENVIPYSLENKNEKLEPKLENISKQNKANFMNNFNVLENNNQIDNEVFNDENDTIFQEYILSDNIFETYDQNHENIDQLLNEDVLNITSNILPKSMNINLQDKEQSSDVVTKEIEELNNQLILVNNDQITIWRKELEQRLLNNDKNSNDYTSEDKSKLSIIPSGFNTTNINKNDNETEMN